LDFAGICAEFFLTNSYANPSARGRTYQARFPKLAQAAGVAQKIIMTELRQKILTLVRKFDGQLMTADQAMWLQGTMNSLDDTLDDQEAWHFLQAFARNKDPEIVISATPPDQRLVKISVSEDGQVSVGKSGFSTS
jgi:hypothetical protein